MRHEGRCRCATIFYRRLRRLAGFAGIKQDMHEVHPEAHAACLIPHALLHTAKRHSSHILLRCTIRFAIKKVDVCRLFSYARVTFPERRQRVQTFILRVSPSTMTRTL